MWIGGCTDSQGYQILIRYSDILIRYGLQCKRSPTCSILINVPPCCSILLSDFSQQAAQIYGKQGHEVLFAHKEFINGTTYVCVSVCVCVCVSVSVIVCV